MSSKGSFRRSVVAVLLGTADVSATPICCVRYSISVWYFYSQILRSLVACLVMSAYTGANTYPQASRPHAKSCICVRTDRWTPCRFHFPLPHALANPSAPLFFTPFFQRVRVLALRFFLRSFRCSALLAFVFPEKLLSPSRAFALLFLLTL